MNDLNIKDINYIVNYYKITYFKYFKEDHCLLSKDQQCNYYFIDEYWHYKHFMYVIAHFYDMSLQHNESLKYYV